MRTVSTALALLLLLSAASLPPLAADEDAAARVLRERLAETRVHLAVDGQEFGDVLDLLRTQTGFNILIDPRIDSDVRENPITALLAKDLPLTTVLDMLADAAGEETVWTVRGNVVLFSYRELLGDDVEVRIYDVEALTLGYRGFGPVGHDLLGEEEEEFDDEEPEPYFPYGSADELVELLKEAVEPTYWEETEDADIHALGERRLIVKAAPRIHESLHRVLGDLTGREPAAIRVEIRVAAGEPALCLTVRSGLPSTAFAGRRRAYVAGYEARFAGADSLPDPIVATLSLGMAARVNARPAPGGGRIHLGLDVAIAEATTESEHESGAGSRIALPGRRIVHRQADLLVEPGKWTEAEGRTGGVDAGAWSFLVRATPVPTVPGDGPASAAFRVPRPATSLDARLPAARPIEEVLWREASLDDVVSNLRTITGLNYYVSPRLRAEVFEEVVISLHLIDTTLGTVLDLVTEPYELEWRAKGDLITLDVKHDRDDDMELRYFDLKDLVGTWHDDDDDFPLPVEGVVDLVREAIGHWMTWEDPAAIEARNGILIARNTPAVLDAVQGMVDGLRATRTQIVTTVDHLETNDDVAQAVLAGDLDALTVALEAGTATRLSQERVVSGATQGSQKAAGEELRYVADYEIRVSEDEDALAAVPEVATLHSGTSTLVRAAPAYDGAIYLEVEHERAMLTEMGQATTPHGPVDLPREDVWRVGTGFRVADGKTTVAGASRAGDRWRLLLVTARREALHR